MVRPRLPYTQKRGIRNFKEFIELIVYQNVQNNDRMTLVTGSKGMGKSSAAISLAIGYTEVFNAWLDEDEARPRILFNDPNYRLKFEVKNNIAYNNEQLQKKIRELPLFSPIIADEAVRFATTEDWNKAENKELKRTLAQVRTKHFFFILCFPLKVMKMDKVYLESYVDYWIMLTKRGSGAIFVKDMNPNYDSWRMNDFKEVGSYNEFTRDEMVEKKLSKHPNYWCTLKMPKPHNDLFKRYMIVRDTAVFGDEGEQSHVSKWDLVKARLLVGFNVVMKDTGLTIDKFLQIVQDETQTKVTRNHYNKVMQTSKELTGK